MFVRGLDEKCLMGDPYFFREAEYMSSIPVSHLTYLVTEVVDKSSIKSAFKCVSVSILVILLLTPVTIKVSKETGDKKAIPKCQRTGTLKREI